MTEPKLLTLTLVNRENLEHEKDRIRHCFTKFRRRKTIANVLKSALYAIESHPDKEGKWHTHIHAVVDMPYMSQNFLSNLWREITGDSFIVDIRRAYSPEAGLNYILKYLIGSAIEKGKFWTVEHLVEFLDAVHNSRLIQAVGELFGLLPKSSRSKELCLCRVCGNALWRVIDLLSGLIIFDEVSRLQRIATDSS